MRNAYVSECDRKMFVYLHGNDTSCYASEFFNISCIERIAYSNQTLVAPCAVNFKLTTNHRNILEF